MEFGLKARSEKGVEVKLLRFPLTCLGGSVSDNKSTATSEPLGVRRYWIRGAILMKYGRSSSGGINVASKIIKDYFRKRRWTPDWKELNETGGLKHELNEYISRYLLKSHLLTRSNKVRNSCRPDFCITRSFTCLFVCLFPCKRCHAFHI